MGRIAEQMLNNQFGIHQKNNRIIKRSPAYTEVFLIHHLAIEHINIKMPVYRIDCIEYGKTFGRLPMTVRFQILGEYLPYRLLYILISHTDKFTANKVKPFLRKQIKANILYQILSHHRQAPYPHVRNVSIP